MAVTFENNFAGWIEDMYVMLVKHNFHVSVTYLPDGKKGSTHVRELVTRLGGCWKDEATADGRSTRRAVRRVYDEWSPRNRHHRIESEAGDGLSNLSDAICVRHVLDVRPDGRGILNADAIGAVAAVPSVDLEGANLVGRKAGEQPVNQQDATNVLEDESAGDGV